MGKLKNNQLGLHSRAQAPARTYTNTHTHTRVSKSTHFPPRSLTFQKAKKPICRSLIGAINVKKNPLGVCERARSTWASLRALIDSCVPRGQINTEVYQLIRETSSQVRG